MNRAGGVRAAGQGRQARAVEIFGHATAEHKQNRACVEVKLIASKQNFAVLRVAAPRAAE
jgi:hypothetical protein